VVHADGVAETFLRLELRAAGTDVLDGALRAGSEDLGQVARGDLDGAFRGVVDAGRAGGGGGRRGRPLRRGRGFLHDNSVTVETRGGCVLGESVLGEGAGAAPVVPR